LRLQMPEGFPWSALFASAIRNRAAVAVAAAAALADSKIAAFSTRHMNFSD